MHQIEKDEFFLLVLPSLVFLLQPCPAGLCYISTARAFPGAEFPFRVRGRGRCAPQSEQGGSEAPSHQCSENLHYLGNFLS